MVRSSIRIRDEKETHKEVEQNLLKHFIKAKSSIKSEDKHSARFSYCELIRQIITARFERDS